MSKISKTKELTFGELRDVASGKIKRDLTPAEQEQVKKLQEASQKLIENFKINLPDFSGIHNMFKSPLGSMKVSTLNTRDYEAEAKQKVLTELMLEEYRVKRQKAKVVNPMFDFVKSEIHFAGKVIKISKGSNEYHVCRAVFSDPTKDWSWDEIVEKWGENPEMKKWQVIYNAAKQVNTKVAIETGIKDLLRVTTKTTSVNPTYIEN